MSAHAQAWAKTQPFITDPTARHVLLVLADYAGADGRAAHPPVQVLARETGLAERTIRAKLDHLEAAGVIQRDRVMLGVMIGQGDPKAIWYDLVLDFEATGQGQVAPAPGPAPAAPAAGSLSLEPQAA